MRKLNTWTTFEKIWATVFITIILAVTFIFSWNGTDYTSLKSILLNWLISPLSAITGILCVVLASRGSIWNYSWGLINCVTYGYVAFSSGYYGDMIINLFYFLPFQFIGYFLWKKHLQKDSLNIVKMKRLTRQQIYTYLSIGIFATLLLGYALSFVDNWFFTVMKRNVSIYTYIDNVFHIPYLGAIFDSSTEVLQIFAQILMVLAFTEQWFAWIVTDIITIIMWGAVILSDKTTLPWALPTLVMWIAYLINAVYGHFNWRKGEKNV